MIRFTGAIIFLMLAAFSKADYCEENFTMAELPGGILKEALSLVILGTIEDFFGCPNNVTVLESDVKFWYYSRNNPTVPLLLDPKNPTEIDPTKKTILFVPGWLCNITNDKFSQLRSAYLKCNDVNIIGIDWTAKSIDLYTSSFCSIPGVAEIIGAFLCHIDATLNIDVSGVHMVGHSLGGQISGLTGQETQKQCNKKLGRISGLDPAGPLYQLLLPDRRLDKSDALFVDVIHTNMAFLGFWGQCGHVDFYPNCGTFQPDCLKIDRNTSASDIINLPLSETSCNHLRAIDYFTESICSTNKNFTSRSCELCPGAPIVGPCVADILFPSYVDMGEHCPSNPEDSKYYLTTNGEPPFAQG